MTALHQGFLTPQVPAILRLLFLAQIFSVFFTGVKLIPGLRNNFGPFEIIGGLLCVLFLLFYQGRGQRLRGHPILLIQLLLSVAAFVSLAWFQGPSVRLGVVQTLILVFQLLFVLVNSNLMVQYQISPERLLRLVTYSALVIGPWILFAGIESGGAIDEAGPFRNRAHMANYMLTAFWLVLLYNSWPGLSRRERLVSFLALASTLYPVAISGRRSVYLSLIIGLVGVGFSFLLAARGRRRSTLAATVVLFAFVGALYSVGPRWLPQLAFFQERVSGIGARLTMAVGDDPAESDANFFELQRIGVMAAFRDYPILGIGWGAFYKSPYSLTSHEVHSTPLRFLAELGLVGLVLYSAMMGVLLLGSLRIVALLHRTQYRTTAVILAVALWSLSVSYVYNRHITERTFWLLLLFYVTFEAFARSVAKRTQPATERAQQPAPRWTPDRVAAAAGRPRR
jgi:O-antigen ligase